VAGLHDAGDMRAAGGALRERLHSLPLDVLAEFPETIDHLAGAADTGLLEGAQAGTEIFVLPVDEVAEDVNLVARDRCSSRAGDE
jgi:hypothetical protein